MLFLSFLYIHYIKSGLNIIYKELPIILNGNILFSLTAGLTNKNFMNHFMLKVFCV